MPAGPARRGYRALVSAALKSAWCVAMLSGVPRPAVAQSDAGPARAPTVTRLVIAFGDLESRLDGALRAHDAGALDRLLAANFELRNAARPGAPVPRAEFIEQMQTRANSVARIEQMAVHDLGETALVSFAMRYGAGAPALFVVDVWGRSDSDWRLRVRYAGPGGAQAAQLDLPVPDAGGTLPKKY